MTVYSILQIQLRGRYFSQEEHKIEFCKIGNHSRKYVGGMLGSDPLKSGSWILTYSVLAFNVLFILKLVPGCRPINVKSEAIIDDRSQTSMLIQVKPNN